LNINVGVHSPRDITNHDTMQNPWIIWIIFALSKGK
jgi:hypothetical protein